MGEREKYVKDLVEQNREALKRIPSAFFSVSMTAAEESAAGLVAGAVLMSRGSERARLIWLGSSDLSRVTYMIYAFHRASTRCFWSTWRCSDARCTP